jgi:hypothetical protein
MVSRPPTTFEVPLCDPVSTIAWTPDGAPRMFAAARVEISCDESKRERFDVGARSSSDRAASFGSLASFASGASADTPDADAPDGGAGPSLGGLSEGSSLGSFTVQSGERGRSSGRLGWSRPQG